MKNAKKHRLIAYDVCDGKNLKKLHRYLSSKAFALQYSVFLATCTQTELETIIEDISIIINPATDDIRIYTLPATPHITVLGKAVFPDGITIDKLLPDQFQDDRR